MNCSGVRLLTDAQVPVGHSLSLQERNILLNGSGVEGVRYQEIWTEEQLVIYLDFLHVQ